MTDNRQSYMWSLIIVATTLIWFVFNLNRGDSRYEDFANLYDPATGNVTRPVDLYNYTQVTKRPVDYLEMTDSIARLYEITGASNMIIPMHMDHKYQFREEAILGGLPTSNKSQCADQLEWIRTQLASNEDYYTMKGLEGFELTRWMESFGRAESGSFTAVRDIWMGSYEMCQKATLRNNTIRGRYCVGRFTFDSWPHGPTRFDPEPALRIAMCLPETCDSLSVEQHNETISWLVKQQLPEYFHRHLGLQSLFCLPDERSPLRQMTTPARIYLTALVTWICFILVASILYEYIYRRRAKEQNRKNASSIYEIVKSNSAKESGGNKKISSVLEGFTLRNSIKSFNISTHNRLHVSEMARVSTDCLYFIKIMMTFGILIAHANIFTMYKTRGRMSLFDLGQSYNTKITITFGRFIDTFFTLTAITTSYLLLQKLGVRKLTNPFIWITSNFIIFLRLAPLHAIVILFNKYITPHLGSGPWWDYGTDMNARYGCAKKASWTDLIPYTINISQSVPYCNPPTWFLGPYIRIAFAIPIITYVIATLPYKILKFLFVTALTVISALNISIALYKQRVVSIGAIVDYGPFLVGLVEKYEQTGYMDTLGRFGSVAIGCYTGYLMHKYKNGDIKKWPRWVTSKLLILVLLSMHVMMLMMPVIGDLINPKGEEALRNPPMTRFGFSVVNFILSPLWSTINALVILSACTRYKDHVVVRFMSHPLWMGAAKLELAIYLIHFEVLISGLTFNEHAPSHGNSFDFIKTVNFGMCNTLFLAIIFYLFFEAPFKYVLAKFITPLIISLGAPRARQNQKPKTINQGDDEGVEDANMPPTNTFSLSTKNCDKP